MTGIRAVGAAAPRFRLSADEVREAWGRMRASGVESTAVPGADEDSLTLGFAAAQQALQADGLDPSSVDVLAFGTSTPPDAEEDPTVRLGAMLGVDEDATRLAFTGSTRAGTRALRAAADRVDGAETALVVASDCPRGHPDSGEGQAAGAGAAAFVLVEEATATLDEFAEHASPYPGHRFRRTGSERVEGLDVTTYDRQAFTETVGAAASALDVPDDLDAAAVQAPDGGLPYRAAGDLGVDTEAIAAHETVSWLGDTGAASVPLSLAGALDAGATSVLGVSYGSGAGADALLVESDGTVPSSLALEDGVDVTYSEYLRLRGEVTSGPPDGGGAYVSMPSWRRTLPQRYRLVAGRCRDCRALAFPPEGACGDCGALDGYDDVDLLGHGTVEAVSTISQGGAPPEFAEQQSRSGDFGVAIVAFEGPEGDTVSAPAQVTDAEPGTLSVGDRVTATVRRLYTQEGVTRYGFKVRPADD
jgi:hydroxymethylglutaryl-CoA synthase